jgi:hypothetical protein
MDSPKTPAAIVATGGSRLFHEKAIFSCSCKLVSTAGVAGFLTGQEGLDI